MLNFDNKKLKNFMNLFFSTFLGKFIGVITISIIARNISVTDKGIYDYYNTIVSYMILMINFGFELYFMELNINKKVKSEYLFSIQVKSRMIVSIFLFISTIIVLILTNTLMDRGILLILLMLKLFSYVFDLTWLLRLDEKFDKLSKYNIINSLLRVILVTLMIKGNNIIALIMIDVLLDYILKINTYMNYKLKFVSVRFKDILFIIKKSFIINISSFMISIYYNIDMLMLGMIRTPYEVAIYNGAYTFLTLAIIPTNIICQIYSPILIKNKNCKNTLKKYIITTSSVGIVVFLVCFFIGPISIKFILGSNYYASANLFKIISIDLIPCYLAGALANPINTWGHYKEYLKIVMLGGIFNLVGNTLLISKFGYCGAIATTIGSECIVLILSLIWWIRNKELFYSKGEN